MQEKSNKKQMKAEKSAKHGGFEQKLSLLKSAMLVIRTAIGFLNTADTAVISGKMKLLQQ